MKIGIILGTRPEIIKFSPILRYLEKNSIDHFIIHTNQHYSENMDSIFFKDLHLKAPEYNLNIGSATQGEQVGKMLIEIEKVLTKTKPDVILVQGDTNTVLAGALSASKLGIKVGHVEAGLRSYDRSMPEEINRVITDHVSDYLFVPAKLQRKILKKEGIIPHKIHLTGNTIVDAVYQNSKLARDSVLGPLEIKPKNYFLATVHRASNVDNPEILKEIISSFESITNKYNQPIIFPIHPRTKKMIESFNLRFPEKVITIDPQGYLEFLSLMKNAKLILTDSGGVQEEACILNVPCVTLRENTERPETIDVGASILAGTTKEKIISSVDAMINKSKWSNPFGNGKASEKIIKILINES